LTFPAKLLGCGDPGTPVNGKRIGDDFSLGAVVFFRCFDDFDLVGSKFRMCQSDGVWSGIQPICKPFNRKLKMLHTKILAAKDAESLKSGA